MILEKLKTLLSHQFEVDEDCINPETKLVEDLGADSLDVVDLAEAVEDEFEIEISDDMIENIRTVGDIVECISELSNSFSNEEDSGLNSEEFSMDSK